MLQTRVQRKKNSSESKENEFVAIALQSNSWQIRLTEGGLSNFSRMPKGSIIPRAQI